MLRTSFFPVYVCALSTSDHWVTLDKHDLEVPQVWIFIGDNSTGVVPGVGELHLQRAHHFSTELHRSNT